MATATKTKTKTRLTTAVALVVDESGSMGHIAVETRSAVNGYLDELQKEAPDAKVSLMLFDQRPGVPNCRVLCSGVDVKKATRLDAANYRPQGFTPLYDAVGKAILDTQEVDADKYLIVIMTDGLENASAEHTATTVKQLVSAKEAEKNWTFVFLGATLEATAQAAAMGVAAGNATAYASTGRGVGQTMSSLATASGRHTQSPASSTSTFFQDAGQTAADYQEKEADKPEPTLWPKQK